MRRDKPTNSLIFGIDSPTPEKRLAPLPYSFVTNQPVVAIDGDRLLNPSDDKCANVYVVPIEPILYLQ